MNKFVEFVMHAFRLAQQSAGKQHVVIVVTYACIISAGRIVTVTVGFGEHKVLSLQCLRVCFEILFTHIKENVCFVLQSKKPFLLAQGGDPLLLASTTRTTTSCASYAPVCSGATFAPRPPSLTSRSSRPCTSGSTRDSSALLTSVSSGCIGGVGGLDTAASIPHLSRLYMAWTASVATRPTHWVMMIGQYPHARGMTAKARPEGLTWGHFTSWRRFNFFPWK